MVSVIRRLSQLFVSAAVCSAFGLCVSHPTRAQADHDAPFAIESQRSVVVDLWGSRRVIEDFRYDDTKLFVLVFMNTECPLVRLYAPRLIEMEKAYRARGVQFLGVYSNAGDTIVSMAAHALEMDLPFTVLLDQHSRVAIALDVKRTPEVVVLDREFRTRYQGLIDDQYRAGGRQAEAKEHHLRDAIDSLLDGKEPPKSFTLATGCLLNRYQPPAETPDVTYTKHIAPIIQRRCESCHRPSQAGPFPLQTYEQVRRNRAMIAEVVEDRRMPPWHASEGDKRFGHFANDRRMSQEEIDTLVAWIRSGAREGEPSDLPKPMSWPSTWTIGEPDVVISMTEPFPVPAQGELPYEYIPVPTNFRKGRWIAAAEVRPGDASVVHHVNVHITRPGTRKPFGLLGLFNLYGWNGERARVLANYVAGDTSRVYEDGLGVYVPAGYNLTFEMHYTPNGVATTDRTSVALKFMDQPPKHLVKSHCFITKGFRIPPHDPHFKVEAELAFEKDIRILNLKPHMHKRGKHWRYELIHEDGSTEVLLNVPRWDYDWQSIYEFADPVRIPAGTRIRATAIWDNSRNNPNNPDPDVEVRWGLDTVDEMMLGWVTYIEEFRGERELESEAAAELVGAEDEEPAEELQTGP